MIEIDAKRRKQPSHAVKLASWLPAGTLGYIGGQKRLLGANYAESGTINNTPTQGGIGTSSGTTSSYINAGKVPLALAGQTWVIQFVTRDTSVRFIAGTTNTGTSYNEQFAVNRDEVGGTLAGAFHITLRKLSSSASLQRSTAGGLITVGRVHTAVIRLVDTATIEIWLDGENRSLTSFGTGPVGDDVGTSEFIYDLLNANNRGSHAFGTNIDLLMFLRTPMLLDNPGELSASPNAPWQLFAPQSDQIPVSAGGGASTITATVSVSAAIQAAQAATASVNAAIQATQSASASVNAAVAQARTVQAALDAAVLQARSTTASVDAAVQQALASTASVDGVIQAAGSTSSGVDAAVQAGQSATTSVNAYVQAGAGLVASIDAYIQAGNSNVATVDAVIQQSRTGNATIDAVVSRALSASASLAAAVLDHRTATASINTYIQAGTTIGAGIEAAIQAQQGASASINAAVSVARLASLGLAAVIAVHASVGAATDAAVLQARSAAVGANAYIYDDSVDTFTVASRRRIGGTPALNPGTRLGNATARSGGRRIGDTTP